MKEQIILIGGMPTAGKSTIAENLSKHLHLPWISTDDIGKEMRAVTNREASPALFTWEDYDGVRFLEDLTADEITDNEFATAEAIWPGVREAIEKDDTRRSGIIIEGDSILPHLVDRDFSGSSNVKAVFIADHNIERMRHVVSTRNVEFFNTSAYTETLQQRDIEWALKFSERLRAEAEKYGFAWIEIEKNEGDLVRLLGALGLG